MTRQKRLREGQRKLCVIMRCPYVYYYKRVSVKRGSTVYVRQKERAPLSQDEPISQEKHMPYTRHWGSYNNISFD